MRATSKSLHRYSFIFWLVVPVLLTWLGASYVIGAVHGKPQWADRSSAPLQPVAASPYVASYPTVHKAGPGLVTFWFDDAWESQYSEAAPILKRSDFTAAIAVPTGVIGTEHYANWAQLRLLQKDGWEITNHTVQHSCAMDTWNAEQLETELTRATNDLWANKLASDLFVSPCGVDSPTLRTVVKSKFVAFRGVEPGLNDLNALDPYDLRVRNVTNGTTVSQLIAWIDEARAADKWVILVFHQVGPEVEASEEKYAIKTEDFESLVEYVKSSGVQVVVPSQALTLGKGAQ